MLMPSRGKPKYLEFASVKRGVGKGSLNTPDLIVWITVGSLSGKVKNICLVDILNEHCQEHSPTRRGKGINGVPKTV